MKKEFENDDITKLYFLMLNEFSKVNDRIENEVGDVKRQFNTIQNSMDYLVGEYQKLSDEGAAEISAHRRFGDALDNHETRIDRLEKLDLKKQAA